MGDWRAGAVAGVCLLSLSACGGAGQVDILDNDSGTTDGAMARKDGPYGIPHDDARGDSSRADGSRSDGAPSDASLDVRTDSGPVDTGPACPTECVPSVPPGWKGPEELYEGMSSPPACGASFSTPPAYDGNDGLTGPPAMCGMCTCDHPAGITCSPNVSVSFFQDAMCTKPCGSSVTLSSYACTNVATDMTGCLWSATGGYLSVTGTKVTGGSCNPSTETTTLPGVTWGFSGQSCAPAAAKLSACSGGGLCAPDRDPGYSTYCVHKQGDQTCPSSGYTTKHVLYGGFTDSRGCTDCTCGDVSPSACAESGVAAFSGACSLFSSSDYTPLPVSCAPIATTSQVLEYTPVGTGGSCTPGGGAPRGSVSPAMATTFCCTP